MKLQFFNVLFCAALLGACKSAKILGLFHIPSPSHHIITGDLIRELAARGHEVTVVSPFSIKENIANYTFIDIPGMLQKKEEIMDNAYLNDAETSYYQRSKRIHSFMQMVCITTLECEGLHQLLTSNVKFDVMIAMPVMCDALLGIAHALDVPVILFMPQSSNVMFDRLFGNTAPYAYVPTSTIQLNYPLQFWDRLKNTLWNIMMEVTVNWYLKLEQKDLLLKYFPDAPTLEILEQRIQLGLFATHPSIESPRPYMPNMIQIGGLQMEKPEHVPEDLLKLLDANGKNGVIYFNFGSNIKSSDLPDDTIKELVEAFRGRDEMILWKFEEQLDYVPKNVVVRNWLPQRGVLAHPNVKVFITHGGLGSVTESVYNGVPMVCIPIFADQFTNCLDSYKKGYSYTIDLPKLNKESINTALDDVISNPKYLANIASRSDLFRSQPVSSMDKAVFWIEHVAKHRGAEHLRSASTQLNWFQLMLVDVIAFILAALAVAFGLIYYVVGKLWNLIFGRRKKIAEGVAGSRKKNKTD